MLLVDVNVLVYAHRRESREHLRFRNWLEGVVNSDAPYGMSPQVLSGFLRLVTNPKILVPPTPLEEALAFVETIRNRPNCVLLSPGPRHWDIFTDLCRKTGAKGNLLADAYLAALAIETGSEWITTDRDFARFPGLQWRHPLD